MTERDPFSETTADPIELFQSWLETARGTEINDPNAMSLATVGPTGAPSVRIVLCKRVDAAGFTFYTNRESRKGGELLHTPMAALCFHWKSLQRQVRVEGRIAEVSSQDADAYFASRHPSSRIGAWASQQSRPLDSRTTLEERTKEFEARFAGRNPPRPPYWTGFTVAPAAIEFWQERPHRLHDRVVFSRQSEEVHGDGIWQQQRLYP